MKSLNFALALIVCLFIGDVASAGLLMVAKAYPSKIVVEAGKDKDGFESCTYRITFEGGPDKVSDDDKIMADYKNGLQYFAQMLQADRLAAVSYSSGTFKGKELHFDIGPGLFVDGDGILHQAGSLDNAGFLTLNAVKTDDAKIAACFEAELTKDISDKDLDRLQRSITYLASLRYLNRDATWFDCQVTTPKGAKDNVRRFTVRFRSSPKGHIAKN